MRLQLPDGTIHDAGTEPKTAASLLTGFSINPLEVIVTRNGRLIPEDAIGLGERRNPGIPRCTRGVNRWTRAAGKSGNIPSCDCCDEPAIFFNPGLNCHLCESHLCASVEQRVIDSITRHGMVRDGDRIAVGLSGGKDSCSPSFNPVRYHPGTLGC